MTKTIAYLFFKKQKKKIFMYHTKFDINFTDLYVFPCLQYKNVASAKTSFCLHFYKGHFPLLWFDIFHRTRIKF